MRLIVYEFIGLVWEDFCKVSGFYILWNVVLLMLNKDY